MPRRAFAIVVLLALSLAAVSPALADEKPEAKPTAKPEAKPTLTLKAKAFQGVISDKASATATTWTIQTAKHGAITVDVTNARLKVPFVKGADRATLLAAFQNGDRVAVKLAARPSGAQQAVYQARDVHLIPGRTFIHFTGVVTADVSFGQAGTGTLTLKGKEETRSFPVTATTVVREGPTSKPTANLTLKAGTLVTVVARAAAPNTALAIRVHDDECPTCTEGKG